MSSRCWCCCHHYHCRSWFSPVLLLFVSLPSIAISTDSSFEKPNVYTNILIRYIQRNEMKLKLPSVNANAVCLASTPNLHVWRRQPMWSIIKYPPICQRKTWCVQTGIVQTHAHTHAYTPFCCLHTKCSPYGDTKCHITSHCILYHSTLLTIKLNA